MKKDNVADGVHIPHGLRTAREYFPAGGDYTGRTGRGRRRRVGRLGTEHTAEVRRATASDADEIARLHVEVYEAALGHVVDQQVLLEARTQRQPMWKGLLSSPPEGQAVFVHGDERLIGFVSAGPDRDPMDAEDAGEIYALFVEPDAWGTGVGTQLLEVATDHVRSLGLSVARLWVLDANARAQTFYAREGWSDLGIVRDDHRGRFFRYGRHLL